MISSIASYHLHDLLQGWDWGPTIITCGPWRPIRLESFTARFVDLHAKINVDTSLKSAEVVVSTFLEGRASHVKFTVSIADITVGQETVRVEVVLRRRPFDCSTLISGTPPDTALNHSII